MSKRIGTIPGKAKQAVAVQMGHGVKWFGALLTELGKELRKFAGLGAVAVLLCLYVYPGPTLRVAVLLGVMLIAAKQGPFLLWARGWSKRLVADGREVPKLKELRVTYKRLQAREHLLVKKWPELCVMHGLHTSKRTPLLVNLIPTLDEDFTAFIPRTGFDPDDIKSKAPKIAKGIGCAGGVVVRETVFGACEVKFNWSNPIRRELPLSELKMPVDGGIAVGHTEHGDPAELRMDASKVFVGVPGSGKSNGAEAALADLIRRGEYVRLRISNPKKNEMSMFKQFEKQAMGRLEVRAYAETGPDNLQMIKDAAHAMTVRNGLMKGRKLTKTSKENPLDITWLDEMMMLPKEAYKDGPFSPLGQLAIAGRASLFTAWGCTQMFYAADFGSVRGLFDERILFRVKTAIQADMVIESATARGAQAHRIHPKKERGVGYIEDEHGELTKFRAAKVEDADLERMIRGQVPEGMITEVEGKRRCCVYRCYSFDLTADDGTVTSRKELEYVGKAVQPGGNDGRFAQHRADDWAFCPIHEQEENWWVVHVDESKTELEWFESEELALAAEEEAIKNELPRWNYIHNKLNPIAVKWQKTIHPNRPVGPKPPRAARVKKPVVWGPDFLPWEPTRVGTRGGRSDG